MESEILLLEALVLNNVTPILFALLFLITDNIYIGKAGNADCIINVESLINQISQANNAVSFHLSFLTFSNS